MLQSKTKCYSVEEEQKEMSHRHDDIEKKRNRTEKKKRSNHVIEGIT